MPTAPSGYAVYKQITISNTYVDSDLTAFPALVKITADTDIGGRAASGGANLRFALSDGTLLNYERQSFSISAGAATGIFWVRVPTVTTAANTVIYCWYDNSGASDGQNISATWDSNFKGVWHLEQDPSGGAPQMTDSTSNGNNGTTGGSMTSGQSVTAQVGKGLSFDGSNDYVSIPIDLSGSTTITVELCLNWTTFANDNHLALEFTSNSNSNAGNFFICPNDSYSSGFLTGTMIDPGGGGANVTKATRPSAGSMHHVAIVFRRGVSGTPNAISVYIDGADVGASTSYSSSIPSNFANSTLYLMSRGGASLIAAGVMDELRISNGDRGAAYTKFAKRNIFEADNCLTWGSEVNTGGGAAFIAKTNIFNRAALVRAAYY